MRKIITVLSTIICLEAQHTHAGDMHVPDARAEDTRVRDTLARDLGVYGEVFPVAERSLLDVIKMKLQALSDSGKLSDHQNAFLQKTKERLNRPEPVEHIHKTTTPRVFIYDPSITVPYDLKDHKGRIFHKKDTKVNPLEMRPLPCPLLFVDGDDETQVDWAIQQLEQTNTGAKPKIILVKGAPFALSDKLGFPVYFDQSGVLVKKIGITQVPARVSQKDKALRVEEVKINRTGMLP